MSTVGFREVHPLGTAGKVFTIVLIRTDSRLAGHTLQEANTGEATGALVLALRGHDGTFQTNPPIRTPVESGCVLIAIGTQQQLSALQDAAARPS